MGIRVADVLGRIAASLEKIEAHQKTRGELLGESVKLQEDATASSKRTNDALRSALSKESDVAQPTQMQAIDRSTRQVKVYDWAVSAFGEDHASSIQQRGIRLLEESIEAFQACGCTKDTAHRLVEYVFNRPVGSLHQEIGGIGVTLLALAQAAGVNADYEEREEIWRVMSKPLEYFRERNAAKNAAGFNVTGGGK